MCGKGTAKSELSVKFEASIRIRGRKPAMTSPLGFQGGDSLVRRTLGGQFIDTATGRRDLLFGRFAEAVGRDLQFLGQFAITKDLDFVKGAFGQIFRSQRLEGDFITILEGIIDPSDVDGKHGHRPTIVESAFGDTPEHRHRTALEVRLATVTAAALVTFVAATGSFSMTATRTSTDPLAFAFLLNAAMDIVKVHDETRFNSFSI